MEIHQLRYFAKVAELGNFTRAAEACSVSQPSLSQQIAKLERELGQPLIERLGRGARLTPAGRQFKQQVDQILHLLEDARARASDSAEKGRLVLAAIPTIAPYFLPAVLTRFAAEHPQAQLEVIEETTARILKLCSQGDVDLAIVALPVQDDQIETETLFTEELLALLPEQHLLARKARLTLQDLTCEPFVLLNEVHCLTNNTLSFCTQHNLSPVVTAQIHQLTTVQELVRLGHGVSLIPAMAARADSSEQRIYRSLASPPPTRTIALAWNRFRYQTQLWQSVVETIRASTPEKTREKQQRGRASRRADA